MCKCGSQMCRVLTWGLKSLHQILEWTLFADHKVLCLILYEICREYKKNERKRWMLGVGQFWWTPHYPSPVPTTIILSPFPFDGRLNYWNLKFEITYKSDSHVKFTPLLCCQLSLITKNEHKTWILAIQHASNTPVPKKTAWWLSLEW